MTYEQEFGPKIRAAMNAAGFLPTRMGGNVAAWLRTLPSGATLTICAYDGQLYAEPDSAVWAIQLRAVRQIDTVSEREALTLDEALAHAALLDEKRVLH